MDPITLTVAVVSILSSTAAFSSRLGLGAAKFKDSRDDFHRWTQEILVLNQLLDECGSKFLKETDLPKSLEGAMDTCVDRHKTLMDVLQALRVERFESPRGVFQMSSRAKYVLLENKRRSALRAYRESVLLIRDLTSELRTNQQLVKMSTVMGELMTEFAEDVSNSEGDVTDHRGNSDQPVRKDTLESVEPEVGRHESPGQNLKKKVALYEMAKLMRSNFTRDITIAIQIDAQSMPIYIPARAKVDTGCDENLVAREVVERSGFTDSELDRLLIPIETEQKITFEGIENATFSPKFQITLTWYQDRQMKSVKETFFVVEDAPFDVNIGLKRFARDFLRSPALILASRHKKKDEKELMRENRRRQLEDADRLEQERISSAQQLQEQDHVQQGQGVPQNISQN